MTNSENSEDPATQHASSRRGFIQGSSLLLASALPASSPAVGREQTLRIGLMGCNKPGLRLAREACSVGEANVEFYGLADDSPGAVQSAARTLKSLDKSRCTFDGGLSCGPGAFHELLRRNCDLLIIAPQAEQRWPYLVEALESRQPAFVEPPFASTLEHVAELRSLQRRFAVDVPIGIGYSSAVPSRQLKAVQEGMIGEPRTILHEVPEANSEADEFSFRYLGHLRNLETIVAALGSECIRRVRYMPPADGTPIDPRSISLATTVQRPLSRCQFEFQLDDESRMAGTKLVESLVIRGEAGSRSRRFRMIGTGGDVDLLSGAIRTERKWRQLDLPAHESECFGLRPFLRALAAGSRPSQFQLAIDMTAAAMQAAKCKLAATAASTETIALS